MVNFIRKLFYMFFMKKPGTVGFLIAWLVKWQSWCSRTRIQLPILLPHTALTNCLFSCPNTAFTNYLFSCTFTAVTSCFSLSPTHS